MQVLKDCIRERIETSAIKLFKAYGFEKVSMRKIAEDAHMTVGNIYRYYNSKDHLFESILKPTLEEILALLSDEITDKMIDEPKKNTEFVSRVISIFLEIHNKHSEVLDILVNSCEGSTMGRPVEFVSELLADRMSHLIDRYVKKNNLELDVHFLADMICEALVDGFIKILYKFEDDESRRIHMLKITQVYTNLFISSLVTDRNEV
ncbi:MAG: TetR/AcrR family transcriptional regulator [Clostridiales bacterium]|nr:TetR/AcrR family transcriptional regulator [Clostridiales bacterium]